VACLQISEFLKVQELGVVDRANEFSDRFVEFKDLPVKFWMGCCEIASDVIPVRIEFSFPVRESESGCARSWSPCGDPVSMSFNRFGRFGCSEEKFEFSKSFDSSVVGCSG